MNERNVTKLKTWQQHFLTVYNTLESLLLLTCKVQVILISEVQSVAFVEIDFDLGIANE